MTEHDVAGIRYFGYDLFEPYVHVTNAVTSRLRGVSSPPYDSLNLAFHVGDDPDAVLDNRAIVAQILGFEPEDFTLARQVHGASVAVVSARDRGKGAVLEDDAVEGVDALVTGERGVPLAVLIADCVAVSLYDPTQHVIAMVHAGWKGTLGRIVERTIERMTESFGTEPSDVLAGLSPSIGPCHYGVGSEVADAFRKSFGAGADRFVAEDPRGSFRLDLRGANVRQLDSAGVPMDRVEASPLCTACRPDLFYSHRRDTGRTGRFAAIIMMGRSYGSRGR